VFEDDYIMRIIRQATQALLYAIGLKKAGQYPDAMQAIDQALEQLLGLEANLARQLSDEALLSLLTTQDQLDVERLELVADFIKEEGDIHAAENKPAESQKSYLRALNYYLEVGLDDAQGPAPDLAQKIESLAEKLEAGGLPDDTLWASFCYYEPGRARGGAGRNPAGTDRLLRAAAGERCQRPGAQQSDEGAGARKAGRSQKRLRTMFSKSSVRSDDFEIDEVRV
jgi:tetratricopeptide (TPR) repeat protein